MLQIGVYQRYVHFSCSFCGHEHFFSDGEVIEADVYEDDADYNADLSIATDYRDLLQWSHNKAINYFEKKLNKSGAKILDIGCFNGFFVSALRRRGFDAYGIDFNRKAIDYGKNVYGLGDVVSDRTLEDLSLDGNKYDAITMFEVIEHLSDFSYLIGGAKALLKPGGVMVVSTPNSRMCWRPPLDSPPHHLSRFSPKSLKSLIELHGLQCISLYEQMSVYDLARNYIGALVRDNKESSLRGGEFKKPKLANALRRGANKFSPVGNVVLQPINTLLYSMGVRYICQVVIAKR